MDGWAERSDSALRKKCWKCGAEIPVGQVYFYVTETEESLPTCWRHVDGETGPR